MQYKLIILLGLFIDLIIRAPARAAAAPPKPVSCTELLRTAEASALEAQRLWQRAAYTQAESLARASLKIKERCLDPEDPSIAASLLLLSEVYSSLQLYTQAIPLDLRALEIRRKQLGPDHPLVAQSLNGLGVLYRSVGQSQRAAEHYNLAIDILERTNNTSNNTYPNAINNRASLYFYNNQFALAERGYLQALQLWKAKFGPDDAINATAYFNLAGVYVKTGRWPQALAESSRAFTLWQQTFGPQHPDVALALTLKGEIFTELGDYAAALSNYQDALKRQLSTLGPYHPDVGRTRRGVAALFARMGRLTEACQQAELAMIQLDHYLHAQGHSLPEAQFGQFVDAVQEEEDALYTAIYPHLSDPQVAAVALALTLHRKGRTKDEAGAFSRAVYRELSDADRREFDRMKALRREYAALSWAGPLSQEAPSHFRARLARLVTEADRIEESLLQHSASLRRRRPLARGTRVLKQISKLIPPGAALVEYVLFRERQGVSIPIEGAPSSRYLAFVLKQDGRPQALDLGPAAAIDSAVSSTMSLLQDSNSTAAAYETAGLGLYRLVLGPMAPHLGATARLIVSPDGALNRLPFSALHDGQKLLEERHLISYITSGQDLFRPPIRQPASREVLVFADPQFASYHQASSRSAEALRGFRGASLLHIAELAPLPGTGVEALAIQEQFPWAHLYLREAATEDALMSVSAPAILHVATHGLFLDDDSQGRSARSLHSHFDVSWTAMPQNPLLRSALVLTGTEAASRPVQEGTAAPASDGIATALEIAGLNLWGTQLVVLSACSTGRGQLKTGQGVYGLRRAIITAGAESLVTTLWKVNDEVTQQLMSIFYQQLRAGAGRAAALQQAARRIRWQYPHPYYWAGFLLLGNSAPLNLH